MSSTKKIPPCPQNGQEPVRWRLTLAQLLEHLDTDVLSHLDAAEVRQALNSSEPPVTFEDLAEALCLGDSPSEHPVWNVVEIWAHFHRDVALLVGAQLGVALATGRRGLWLGDYQDAWRQAAEEHRGVLEARRAFDRSLPSAGASQEACDPWCCEPHGSPVPFHHLGATTKLELTESAGRDQHGPVELRLSRFVSGPDEPERRDPTALEVHWPENAGIADFTLLELDEAERLARALLLKVADARSGADRA